MKKLIVITGGTKGIGRAVAFTFASHGFDIVTCARSEKDLQVLQQDIQSSFPDVQVFIEQADVAKKTEVEKFGSFIKDLQRKVDILVNNAGYFVPGQLTTEPEGTLEKIMDTNLYSAYHLTRQLAPGMTAAKDGYIFNMCSIASFMAYPNGGAYTVTKFALLGMSKVLREELKPHGIRVTAIMPGATLTASWEGVDLPAERFMKPEDVAETMYTAYALSKQSVVEEILIRPQLGDL